MNASRLHRAGPALAIALGLAMALRLAALPSLLPQPSAGLVPICAGGQIVYLAIGADGPLPDGAPAADPCPVFGLAHAVPAAPPALPVRAGAAASAKAPVGASRGTRRAPPAYRPRAPPRAA